MLRFGMTEYSNLVHFSRVTIKSSEGERALFIGRLVALTRT